MPTFTIRIPEGDHEALAAMALLTNKTMAELVREAIIDLVTRFANNSEQIERQIEEDATRRRAALKKLQTSTRTKIGTETGIAAET